MGRTMRGRRAVPTVGLGTVSVLRRMTGAATANWRVRAVALLLALFALPCTAAIAAPIDPREAIARSEAAIGRTVAGHVLTEANGATLPIEALRGKPLIISLVYTSCAAVCPLTTRRLEDAVRQANQVIGPGRFGVITIGFDARHDTPRRVAQFAADHGVRAPNWRFASADAPTLERLLNDLGFSYAAIAGGFDHVAQTTILDRDGRVARQVYGDEFPVQMLLEPLKDAVYGRAIAAFTVDGLLDRIRFLCTAFDPSAGRYRINYGLVFGSGVAAISLLVAFALLGREWRRSTRGSRPGGVG